MKADRRIARCTLAAALLLAFSCSREEPEIIITPQRHWVNHTVAVVAPLGAPGVKTRLERTADWFLQNFREGQMLDTLAIDLQLEWYDEAAGNLEDLSEELAGREDIDAIIGPFGNDPLTVVASACYRKEKPLIAPVTTSEEIVRRYAVASATGQQQSHPFLWALTESDVKLVETLISGHATLVELDADLDEASAILLAPDNYFGQTFNYWAPFFAQNFNLDLVFNDVYSGPEDIAGKMDDAIGANLDKELGIATLCVVETPEQFATAARAHRHNAMLSMPYLGLGTDPDNPRADIYWTMFSTVFRPYFIFPNISKETLQALGERDRLILQGYQGYSPYADPSTGFEQAYKARFGTTPTFAECKFYDALMLSAFAIDYAEHQGLKPAAERNRQINESIIVITAPADDESIPGASAWNPTAMQFYLQEMEKGHLYHFMGAAADISFDKENYTATTHTTYVRWQIFDGEPCHSAYFGGGGVHNADATAAWNYLFSQEKAEQDFADYTLGAGTIEYPALTDQYAVLVQGSDGFKNYRHQADVLSVYQLLRQNGFEDDHIILILDSAISGDEKNSEKGVIRAKSGGKDLLGGTDGLPAAVVDYDVAALTPQDIADILQGNSSEKCKTVLPKDKGQNVLFYWSGHGRSKNCGGANEFCWRSTPSGQGFTDELMRQTAAEMLSGQACRKLLVIAEPCFGECVVRSLEGIQGALAITGASANEQSWADNWNGSLNIWMSDRFSQNVVESLTLQPQGTYKDLFLYCARHTLGSHARIVNAACFGNLSISTPQEFIQKR